jgi:hypothetical protein
MDMNIDDQPDEDLESAMQRAQEKWRRTLCSLSQEKKRTLVPCLGVWIQTDATEFEDSHIKLQCPFMQCHPTSSLLLIT